MPETATLRQLEKKINSSKRAYAAFMVAACGSVATYSAGMIGVVGTYTTDQISQDHSSIMPSKPAQRIIGTSSLLMAGGLGSAFVLVMGGSAVAARRRKLEQKKFQLSFRIVEGMLQPHQPKR